MAVTTFKISPIYLNSFYTARLAEDKGWNLELMGEAFEETRGNAGLPRDWSDEEIFEHKKQYVQSKFKEHIEGFAKETITKVAQAEALHAQAELDEQLAQRQDEIAQTLSTTESTVASNIGNSFTVETK